MWANITVQDVHQNQLKNSHYIQRARMYIQMIDEAIWHRGGEFTSVENYYRNNSLCTSTSEIYLWKLCHMKFTFILKLSCCLKLHVCVGMLTGYSMPRSTWTNRLNWAGRQHGWEHLLAPVVSQPCCSVRLSERSWPAVPSSASSC